MGTHRGTLGSPGCLAPGFQGKRLNMLGSSVYEPVNNEERQLSLPAPGTEAVG